MENRGETDSQKERWAFILALGTGMYWKQRAGTSVMLYKAISQMNKSILLLIHHDPQSSGPPMF